MKKSAIVILIICLVPCLFYFLCRQQAVTREQQISKTILRQVDNFNTIRNYLYASLQDAKTSPENLKELFLALRSSYKKMEWAMEYFTPVIAKAINGAPVPEVEANGIVTEPSGLQVMEPMLFPSFDPAQKGNLIRQLSILQTQCEKANTYFSNIDLLNWQIFDAVRLEVFRIETLGITGFDNGLSLQSMQESSVGLEGVSYVVNAYTKDAGDKTISTINAATNYLQNHKDFNSFDRSAFIRDYANPITISIGQLETRLNVDGIVYNRLLNQNAKTLFDSNAFNSNAFTLIPIDAYSEQRINLGKALFADPVFSGNRKRSCQTCHQPDRAFTDGLAKNTIINGTGFLARNTPTLWNAALQPAQFYDLRATTLEEQVADAIKSANEMNGSMKYAAKEISGSETYKKLFNHAFPNTGISEIDSSEIIIALASYLRSLVALSSRFDDYMKGNKTAMSQAEINGFNLFMGKARCATCHYMPLFNGTLPPRYIKTDAEVIGVPQLKDLKIQDTDMGAYNVARLPSLKHAFKIPTLRNAARTAPYMHNGVFSTLEEVIGFYNNGGGSGAGFPVENQTLASNKLNLTKQEVADLVAFIKCLDNKKL